MQLRLSLISEVDKYKWKGFPFFSLVAQSHIDHLIGSEITLIWEETNLKCTVTDDIINVNRVYGFEGLQRYLTERNPAFSRHGAYERRFSGGSIFGVTPYFSDQLS